MLIRNMFEKDISREISGVIKASEIDENKIYQELEEYVVTKEVLKHLNKFYENYSKGISGTTDKMGVWISGFFGSGKSHFLKILSYLLENESVFGKKPIEFFKDKVQDEMLYAEMERISKINTETILFNIDSKNPINNKNKEDAILRIFVKVFNEHRNLCSEIPGVAYMEEQLMKDEVYEQFKTEFMNIRGKEWMYRRNAFLLDKDYVAQAISKVLNISLESANEYVRDGVNNYEISIEKFAKQVKEYIEGKGENFHLVFLVDEIGQYIGDNKDLMLNLQTVAEDLGTYCKGKVWIMVTSQESIDSLVKVKGDDFSKIQGRFDTRLSMSSISVDEVIKKRILEKDENAVLLLKDLYREKNAILKNLINFENARKDLLSYADEEDFVEVYPFIPYQFKILQSVFEQVRKHGSSGKHLSEGERSMISAFKESVLKYADKKDGILIPFHAFYNTIEEFLNPSISRVIERASKNPELKENPMNIQLLKLLFMIKYLNDEVPSNLENIATLMITNIDEDKLQLKEELKKCLRKLQSQTLIQKNGDNYIFLTDDEQDVNKDIENEIIEDETLRKEIIKDIFSGIYDAPKYKYSKNYSFTFNKKLDDIGIGNQTSNLCINILTPLCDSFYKSDEDLILKSFTDKEIIIKLTDEDEFIEELREALKIESYVRKKNISSLPENKQAIITIKQGEMRLRKSRVKDLLEKALVQGNYYINGEKAQIKGSSAREKINAGFNLLTNSVFNKLGYINVNISDEAEIVALLKNNIEQLGFDAVDQYDNALAEKEIFDFICFQEENHQQIRMKIILNRFSDAPYGWNEIDIAGVVSKLLKKQNINIMFNGEFLEPENPNKVLDALTKTANVDRVIINKKIKVDETLIRKVKTICLDAFGSINLPDDEDSIIIVIKDKISKEVEKINSYLNKYEGKKYPGKSLFQKGLSIFREITDHRDNLGFFTEIKNKEDELLDWIEDVVYAVDFFKSQKEIFDKGLEISKKCEDNKDYLEKDLLDEVAKLNEVLNDPMPYKKIRNILDIVSNIEKGFNLIIEDKKEKAKERIKNDYDYCLLKSNQYGVKSRIAEAIKVFYDKQLNDIENYKDIYRLDASITISSNKREYFEGQIDNEISAYKKILEEEAKENTIKETKEEIKIPQVKPKKVEKITVSKLVDIKSLKTEADIEVYIRELKNRLTSIIKEDKEIEIE
ncbi:BREX system P-loop protein BrxC [Haloimpatiens sp. FM7330]|uniref:BREX system P-loop protein BrxC n=1 Tax=Haloimpatiens sp. FM7330 TaxID=3298610 RepID=UPI00363EB313